MIYIFRLLQKMTPLFESMINFGNNWNPTEKYMIRGDVFDYGSCSTLSYFLTYFYISLATILFIMNLYLFSLFIYKDFKNPILESSFYLGIMFGFISIILIPLSIRNILMICYHHIFSNLAHKHLLSWFAVLYFIQLYLSWLMLFERLHIATVQGAYKFNNCIITSFKILLSLCPLVTMVYVIYLILHEVSTDASHNDRQSHKIFSIILVLLLMVFGAIIPILLAILFIHKLMEIYEDIHKYRDPIERQKHDKLVSIITRSTVLSVVSVSVTILTIMSFFVHIVLSLYMGLLNICCNFICIMFAYQHFLPMYRKICCLLDSECESICFKIVDRGTHRLVRQNDEMCIGVDGQKRHQMVANTDDNEDEDEDMDMDMDILEECSKEMLMQNDIPTEHGTDGSDIRHVEIVDNVNMNIYSPVAENSMDNYARKTESAFSTKTADIDIATTTFTF
eukprot:31191_1